LDNHDIAHYAIAAALALGGGATLVHLESRPPVNATHVARVAAGQWTPLTEAQLAPLGAALRAAGPTSLVVYFTSAKSQDIAEDFVDAANAAGLEAHAALALVAPPGVSVGAPDAASAQALARAIDVGAGGLLKPRVSAAPAKSAYVAFGAVEK